MVVKERSFDLFFCLYFLSETGFMEGIAEERRKKKEGRRKILLCLSFKLLICPNLCFDCYKFLPKTIVGIIPISDSKVTSFPPTDLILL
ncbi:hypothetical protein [Okeania sp. SIO2B3]|uniref:hypothetical protein n=1 Tax=Okeania sp. SIO2B3 TaxID=2607784 RepID=UPI0013C2826F|nr:hypothetical protein [Okeania sp. SIO2B3]NET42706.1 hypothetical protein [Okeania sp. SIO2B3]